MLQCSEYSSPEVLTFTTIWANSADNKLVIFSYFSQKTRSDISCKLSPLEIICMKCQNLFWRKLRKNISLCHLLKSLPSVLSVKNSIFI